MKNRHRNQRHKGHLQLIWDVKLVVVSTYANKFTQSRTIYKNRLGLLLLMI